MHNENINTFSLTLAEVHRESFFTSTKLNYNIKSALVYPYNIFGGVKFKLVFDNGDRLILHEAKEPDSEHNLSIIKPKHLHTR